MIPMIHRVGLVTPMVMEEEVEAIENIIIRPYFFATSRLFE
jgi:hypothetical protein